MLPRSLADRFGSSWRILAKEISAFGVVGLANLILDNVLFSLLHFRAGMGPTTSSVIASGTATTVSYFANRHWSFSHRARTSLRREYSLFIVINLIALGITSVMVAFAYYVLDVDSALALTFVRLGGIAIGTVFRFWSYKRFVFPPQTEDAPPADRAAA